MALKAPIPCLIDIIEAAELIHSELNGVTLDEFEGDRRKRWLIEGGMEIISEASRRLSEVFEGSASGNSIAEGGRHWQHSTP